VREMTPRRCSSKNRRRVRCFLKPRHKGRHVFEARLNHGDRAQHGQLVTARMFNDLLERLDEVERMFYEGLDAE